MKQTAVDILYKFLYEMESFEGFDPYSFNQEDVFKKAKDMEKEQIIEAYETAMETDIYNEPLKIGKDYFNQTFKSE
jgi:hypothetical protein